MVGSVRSHLVSELITGRFRRWIRDRGSEPLITYYDLASGERTELSGISFANWVDKTSNLLVDELMVEPADQVELSLATTHPGHWVTLVWELACWQVGAVVTLGQPSSAHILAAGPEPSTILGQNFQLVICSLHPLGLGLPTPPTGGALDYALEVRGQPDQHAAPPQSTLALAWRDQERQLTQAELDWKANGTATYQRLAQRSRASLREVAPLSEVEPDRPSLPTDSSVGVPLDRYREAR